MPAVKGTAMWCMWLREGGDVACIAGRGMVMWHRLPAYFSSSFTCGFYCYLQVLTTYQVLGLLSLIYVCFSR